MNNDTSTMLPMTKAEREIADKISTPWREPRRHKIGVPDMPIAPHSCNRKRKEMYNPVLGQTVVREWRY